MHMGEEKKTTQFGFKIKWADREIEYYGDSVLDVFNKVFEHVISVPITLAQPAQGLTQTSAPAHEVAISTGPKPAVTGGDEYDRISKDAKISKEEILKFIKFEKRDDFEGIIPILPKHPESRDAVRLVSYALQVGLQQTPIEVSYLKRLLKGPNGYPLPGNELGLILADFRTGDVLIASQTQGRNKPFSLSTKGLDQARDLFKADKK
jgi:hypothetical protein